jgi:hypothetical protein
MMRLMRAALVTTVALTASATPQAAQPAGSDQAPPAQVEKAFPPGGTITMDLSAGHYTIRGTGAPAIRIRWTTRDVAQSGSVYAKAQVSGSNARVDVSGPSNGFDVSIEVPQRSDLSVSLSAGDLSIGPLDGSQDVSAWAGKIQLALQDLAQYSSVYASVTAGQIRAEPLDTQKGGLFRSVSWEGKGRYALRVRLTAGDVILHRAGT